MDGVGIKTDAKNCTLVIEELVTGDMDGLISYLGNGFFVVTKEAHDALIKLGIEMQVKEIHRGKPPSSDQGEDE